VGRYKRAGRKHKKLILDEFCEVCGYERKWVIKVLNRRPGKARSKGGAKRKYGAELLEPLKKVWFAAQQPNSRSLKEALPLWLPYMELEDAVRGQLLSASARTLDRLLGPLRARHGKGRCGTKPGGTLKKQIPIRTNHDDVDRPGYLGADTVSHCGGSLEGDYVWTLTLTDVESGWTCLRAVWNKGQHGVHSAIGDIEATLPFKLLGFKSDNGGEFINRHLQSYLGRRQTRGRPHHKNDNPYAEQKNWTHARQLLGYDRLGNPATLPPLNELFRAWEELQNHFRPSMRLLSKLRTGAKITRRHDTPATPCDRLLASTHVDEATKAALRARRAQLDPFKLSQRVETLLRLVWQANRSAADTRSNPCPSNPLPL
jgi:hypothetical protein